MSEWNPEHLAKLHEGLGPWNAWRRMNPFVRPDLEDADLRGLVLATASLFYVNLRNTSMDGVEARRAELHYANLGSARLSAANLEGALCHQASFIQAQINETRFEGAHLSYCNFSGASMRGADLRKTNLENAIFSHTDLTGADLTGSHCQGTIFGAIDFRTTRGLEDVVHRGPSTIGLDSLVASEGQIPDVFLRGAGVSDALIQYAASLVARPIQFYSCFISYSGADDSIARRLHADLQVRGVRCWFAPEDLKIGDKFRQRIDQSIRTYEKLLVILSAASIESPWVESEVEAAFEREHRTGRLVLFPIRLDDAVMETEAAWASELRRARHIADFRNWKQHEAYTESFERLMRDLRSEEKSEK